MKISNWHDRREFAACCPRRLDP